VCTADEHSRSVLGSEKVLGVGSQAHKDWVWATGYGAPQQWLAESVDLGGQQDDGVGCTIEWAGYCAGAVFGCFDYACHVCDMLIGLFYRYFNQM
jgi:hypothetical protein